MRKLISFLKEEDGVTAIEYGLIAAGIGVAIATVVYTVGEQLRLKFEFIQAQLTPDGD
jgi:pilus assembly protein Flp/PilA